MSLPSSETNIDQMAEKAEEVSTAAALLSVNKHYEYRLKKQIRKRHIFECFNLFLSKSYG